MDIPEERKNYYQAHFTYQVAVRMYSARELGIVLEAFAQYSKDRDSKAFADRLEPALMEQEQIIAEAHKAEYGIWEIAERAQGTADGAEDNAPSFTSMHGMRNL